jgi:hypothetical protein
MPYIRPERREDLDPMVDALAAKLREMVCVRGDLNYVVTQLVLSALKPDSGWSYHSLSDTISVLRDAADEIARRMLGPYEDKAAAKNGDCSVFSPKLMFELNQAPRSKLFDELVKRWEPKVSER